MRVLRLPPRRFPKPPRFMSSPSFRLRIVFRVAWLAAFVCSADVLGAAHAPVTNVAAPAFGKLELHRAGDAVVIQFGGKSGELGIPSWRAVVRPESGGNISAFHVPAHNPASLGSRDAHDAFTMVAGRNGENLVPTLYKGREHYQGFRPEVFEIKETSAERIVIHVAGPSRNKFYTHDRTYVFTPAGVEIAGMIDPHVNLEVVSFMPHWDRRMLADTHMQSLPLRTQGRHGWILMGSSGQDGASSLPGGVDFPLEAEVKLRLPTPTFVRMFYDKPFEAAAGTKRFVHNNKDMFLNVANRVLYEKLTGITGFPVPKGAKQNYKVRFVFETQAPLEAMPAGTAAAAN